MRGVAITGVGVLSPYGEGALKLLSAMMEGKRGERIDSPIPKVIIKSQNKRLRLDRISKMALYTAWVALEEGGYEYENNKDTIGISLGTTTGGLDQSIELVSRLFENELDFAAPMIFPNSVKNAPANQIAIALSIYGTNITFAGGIESSIIGVREGMILIGAGKQRAMLAGGVEEIVAGEVEAQKGLGSAISPAAWEGGSILCLEALDEASKRGADILAELAIVATGYEKKCTSSVMERLYDSALQKAGLSSEDIDLAIIFGKESHEAFATISPSLNLLHAGESLILSGAMGASAIAMGAYIMRHGMDRLKPENVAIVQNVDGVQFVVILKSVMG